jgi:hypothetical protein
MDHCPCSVRILPDSVLPAPAGKVLVSGLVAKLDGGHAAGLLRLAAASLPHEAFLVGVQSLQAAAPPRPLQRIAQPRKPRPTAATKPAPVQLASVGIELQSWALSYGTAPCMLPDHSSRLPHGNTLQVQHHLAITSIGAELLLPAKTATAHIAELAVSQEQQQHAAAELGGVNGTSAAAKQAHVCQLLRVATISAGALPPGHAALTHSGAQAEASAGSTGSAEADGGAEASRNGSSAAGPAIDLDVSGVSLHFEPDVVFGAVDAVAELAAIAEQARQQLPQHWQQRLRQRSRQKSADGSTAPKQRQAGAELCMAVRLHTLAAKLALTPDTCFAVKVGNDDFSRCLLEIYCVCLLWVFNFGSAGTVPPMQCRWALRNIMWAP